MNSPERAQSEVIGAVLLLGLTITAVGITAGIGANALADAQASADIERIEGSMTQVDSKASLVAHGGSTSQRVRLDPGRSADVRADGDAGVMRIEVEAETETGGTETVTKNVTLGVVVYERGDDRVAYQGGGVWRSNGEGSWMISPPEFHYRGDTLTLPLVTVDGDGLLDDSAVVTGGHPVGLFPSENVSNPLLGGNVTITVESEYAEGWGRFFETRTRANVTQLSPTEVQVALRTRTVHPAVSASASAIGAPRLEFGGINTLYADSYDSADGPYPGKGSASDNAVIQAASDFHLTAGGGGNTESIEIRGDLVAESYKIPNGQSDKLTVTGERRVGSDLGGVTPVSGAITARMNEARDATGSGESGFDLDNGSTVVIDTSTTFTGDVTVSDGTLQIEDGATVLVEGDLTVQGSGAIRSTDGAAAGNPNELLVDGTISVDDAPITTDTRFELYNTDTINVTGQARLAADGGVARNLWVYSSADDIAIDGEGDHGVAFTGVLYAPESSVTLTDAMTFNGSFTSGSFGFNDADLDLHYDESLRNLQPFEGEAVPVVSHLHVSKHQVKVESE
ncbi:hypothetical protein DJ69_15095 [Halorubrum persicum]|uniref:DUF7305 domain-containing protein n=1 Tax=Halorubrum persicum TaxID=1383844 RepID=A0A2G1WFU4_9EURY|nr:archaellin/type IV pilin N-terminal domain-containing protein [Halorubrum persicum]PHQ37853.1 hypothetical protein DJ69_15095 [Halorubrum persicum]